MSSFLHADFLRNIYFVHHRQKQFRRFCGGIAFLIDQSADSKGGSWQRPEWSLQPPWLFRRKANPPGDAKKSTCESKCFFSYIRLRRVILLRSDIRLRRVILRFAQY